MLSVFLLKPEEGNNFPFLRLIIIMFASTLLIKYFIYMVVSPWHDVYVARISRRSREVLVKNKNYQQYQPLVSVLVPACNEEDGILVTLKSLLNSTYKNLEIIVIDNASTDNTKVNVRRLIRNYRLKTAKEKMELKFSV